MNSYEQARHDAHIQSMKDMLVPVLRSTFRALWGNTESDLATAKALAGVAEAVLTDNHVAHEAVVEALQAEGVFNCEGHDAALPSYGYGKPDPEAAKVCIPAIVAALQVEEG